MARRMFVGMRRLPVQGCRSGVLPGVVAGVVPRTLHHASPAQVRIIRLASPASRQTGEDPWFTTGRANAAVGLPGDHRTDVVTTGVARSVGEVVSGSVAIASPIFREDGIVAAIGVTGPEGRCGLAWRTRVARLLPGAASSIVGALGPGPGLSSYDSRYAE